MAGTVFVTGADRGLGLALCAGLLEQGWQVFAGQYLPEWPELSSLAGGYPQTLHLIPLDVGSRECVRAAAQSVGAFTEHLDVLINNAGIYSSTAGRPIRAPQDYTEMQRLYDVNALGPLRVVEAFLSLTDRGGLKRLCFVSSEAGSIARAERTAWFGYCMSKAALNMGVRILFNDLHAEGYTFRLYHPGWIRSYMTGEKNMEATLEPEQAAARAIPFFLDRREEEGRLVLVDHEGNEWPW
ncbi:MAG TPA: SDR family NAD(P)-dependent oxidoreductase [Anaerolineales bacterium]|nr:SDR family NAD(P)-dependent oxidoreductase [Anaerolineales bacterium]